MLLNKQLRCVHFLANKQTLFVKHISTSEILLGYSSLLNTMHFNVQFLVSSHLRSNIEQTLSKRCIRYLHD